MAEIAQTEASSNRMVFRGQPRSIVSALALLLAGVLTFTMGMNTVFFVEAMAWTFLIWGALLMYSHVMDYGTHYIVDDNDLVLYSPLRFWGVRRTWAWDHISRMDLVVERVEARTEDVEMQVYHTPEGTTRLQREDMPFIPDLAREIAARARLSPERNQTMQDFDRIPQDNKGTYRWSR